MALRQALPISSWLTDPEGAGSPLLTETYRLVGVDSLVIDAGARSISCSVLAGEVTYATAAGSALLPTGYTLGVSSDWPNDEYDEATITTGVGDDVFVIVVRVA